jgi:phosphate transport system substrate-binding protein
MRTLIIALGLVAGCGVPKEPASVARPTLRLGGTPALAEGLLKPLGETHLHSVATHEFSIASRSTSELFRDLLAGELDMIAVDRQARPAEQEQALQNGYSLNAEGARSIVAVDVVAIAVHASNPIESLTYDQVIDIFCTGDATSWDSFGMEGAPIKAYTLDPLSGRRGLAEDFFCGPAGMDTFLPQRNAAGMAEALTNDPHAIGIVSAAHGVGKLVGLRNEPGAQPVFPSQTNVIRGAYPLALDIYMYTAGPATGGALDFVDWIDTPAGQEVVDEARFLPLYLRPERLDEPRPLRETVSFELGTDTPTQRSVARMEMLKHELRDRTGEFKHVVLEGYTDDTERSASALSRARAQAVQAMLEPELPGVFFEIIPRGARNPIAPNETPMGRQQNRRVQIYLEDDSLLPDSEEGAEEG